MRIVVMSDSHGNAAAVEAVVAQQPNAKLFIHLGDGLQEFKRVMESHPNREYWCVRGNSDFMAAEESLVSGWVRDIKLVCTHGHHWSVKFGLDELKEMARDKFATIVLYGHTHAAHNEYDNGLYILNPGSVSSPRDTSTPTYAIIDIEKKNVVCSIVELHQ